jgi:hypothetical protein
VIDRSEKRASAYDRGTGRLPIVSRGLGQNQDDNPLWIGHVRLSQLIRSRAGRFFGTIKPCGPDWTVNRLDRKPT